MRGLDALFAGPQEASRFQTIMWWEKRLPIYNVVLFVVGCASGLLCIVILPDGNYGNLLLSTMFYVIMANLCFQLGPLADILFWSGRPRASLFKAGMIFAVGLTSLPGFVAIVAWLRVLVTGKKLS